MIFQKKYYSLILIISILALTLPCQAQSDSAKITDGDIVAASKILGIDFTKPERDSLLGDLEDNLSGFNSLRENDIGNEVAPALYFDPLPRGFVVDTNQTEITYSDVGELKRPENLSDLAFYTVRQLGELIRTKQITSVELTKLSIERLTKYDPKLHCVITLTEELALKQATRADEELAAGKYRGPLHGIPYGAKDLLSAKGYPTTWGGEPYKNQIIDEDATVIKRLEEAGAVLVAKLTLGALAWGDVWFGDTTRNPWNLEQGSSGSSAGPASAAAAGLLPFTIGSETWGSIVSPSTRCGATGLRPTFGRVSRAGAMALSWSMDKLGPICRSVEDCAIVFDAIRGSDGLDPTIVDAAFNYSPEIDFSTLRIGYIKSAFEEDSSSMERNNAVLETMRSLGAELIEFELPQINLDPMPAILVAEAAAAFDELTRSNRDDLLVKQVRNAWPNVFRASRFIPAVEYIQANRLRTILIEQMHEKMQSIDVYISPPFAGSNLLMTNLTGHPCVVLPNGFNDKGTPESITFMGRLFGEATLLAVAKKYQDATEHHLKHPSQFTK